MKLKSARTKSSTVDQDEYQPFLSQPTLYIPNPPPTVKLQHIALALTGYGTSIHSIFFISVKQRPRLGKFSGRSMRRKWVRVEFSSIEMAEQAYVTFHRRPIPNVTPQVLLNFRFTPYFPSVPSNLVTVSPTASVVKKTSASQTSAVKQTHRATRHIYRKPSMETQDLSQTQRRDSPPSTPSQNNNFAEVNACGPTRESTEYTRFLEALDEPSGNHSQEEVEDYNSDRVLYPIDEEAEEGDLEEYGTFLDVYSDAGSSIERHKLDSLDTTQHEIDTANTTAESGPPAPLKSNPPSLVSSLKRIHPISVIPVPFCPPLEDDVAPKEYYATLLSESQIPEGPKTKTSLSESLKLVDVQTNTINTLRTDLHDILKAADSQALIIEGLRKLIRQLEWDKSDLLGMLECTRETSIKQLKLLQDQVEEMESRMGFIEARLHLAETKCRLFKVNQDGLGTDGSQMLKEEIERRKLSELEESCQRLGSMIAHDAHQRHLAVRRDRVRLREKLVSEQARRLVEQEERNQILMKEKVARKIYETEDQHRREKDRRRRLRNERAESKERKRCRERDIQLWGTGEWTSLRALERFKILLTEFESVAFTEDQPLTMGVIPWPILTDPFEIETKNPGKALEELEWGMVEAFFKEVNRLVGIRDYRSLLERSNMAFHPDRWKARRMLDTVVDDEIRGWLEAKGNMVAQAVTPLWRESKRSKM